MHGCVSHPMWVRGLKFIIIGQLGQYLPVAPHVGAWIEMAYMLVLAVSSAVAPHVGAWIEIAPRQRSAI